MYRTWSDRRVKSGAGAVDQPISENNAIERRIEYLTFKARYALYGFSIDGVRFSQKRILLAVRQGTVCVDERDALRD